MPTLEQLTAVYDAAKAFLGQPIHSSELLCCCSDGSCTACDLRDRVREIESEENDA